MGAVDNKKQFHLDNLSGFYNELVVTWFSVSISISFRYVLFLNYNGRTWSSIQLDIYGFINSICKNYIPTKILYDMKNMMLNIHIWKVCSCTYTYEKCVPVHTHMKSVFLYIQIWKVCSCTYTYEKCVLVHTHMKSVFLYIHTRKKWVK